MSFLAWIVLGLISGFIASKMVNNSGAGAIANRWRYCGRLAVQQYWPHWGNRLKSLQHPSRRCWRGQSF